MNNRQLSALSFVGVVALVLVYKSMTTAPEVWGWFAIFAFLVVAVVGTVISDSLGCDCNDDG